MLFRGVHAEDVEVVKANMQPYVLKVVRAMVHDDYLKPQHRARSKTISVDEAARWNRWQQDHLEMVNSIFSVPKTAQIMGEVEACAWLVVEAAIKAHESGYVLTTTFKADQTSACSKRIDDVVQVIKDFAIMRYDILHDITVDEFVANPRDFAQCKVKNMWNNTGRRTAGTQIRARAATSLANPKTHNGAIFTRRFTSAELADMKSGEKQSKEVDEAESTFEQAAMGEKQGANLEDNTNFISTSPSATALNHDEGITITTTNGKRKRRMSDDVDAGSDSHER